MMEFLAFTFEGPWHFIGVLILLALAANTVVQIVAALRR